MESRIVKYFYKYAAVVIFKTSFTLPVLYPVTANISHILWLARRGLS